ncbi:unnamed protein product [Schistosoma margrebowiei]|uniref:Uncharacterized protein n=1 Tax=Schistosoma margrebowiei TaxID=48269 RepID=A0A183LJW3_9TREM|nr:unnamed protein product [Schistosoma margrebowiei]
MRQLYDITKKLAGKCVKGERKVRDKEGKTNNETQEQRKRWVEHFDAFSGRPAPLNPLDIEAAHTDLRMTVALPIIEELRVSIRQIKSGKAVALEKQAGVRISV